MAHTYCPACSGEIPAGAAECPQCGRRNEHPHGPAHETEEKKWGRAESRGALLFGVGFGLGYAAMMLHSWELGLAALVLALAGVGLVLLARAKF
jgi:hypothetical protein